MVNQPPPAPGSAFGPYRIDSVIAQGRTGVLYVATDQRLGRPVALKVVVGTLAASADFVDRFQREAATLARLESPHVVQIFDHGVQDGLPFIATQYAAGGDLGALVARLGPMPPAMAAQAVSQVAEALRDAHRAGVVHRNLKPRNVLLRDERLERVHVLVCDFGVGPAADSNVTEPASAPGAWNYLPPERLEGKPATEAGDIYAAGCLLHEVVTGRPPYTGTDVQVAMAHLQSPVPQLDGTDGATQQLNRILARTLSKDPAERGTAEDLRSDLRTFAGILSAPPAAPAPSEMPTVFPGSMPPPPSQAPTMPPAAYQSLSVPQAPPYPGTPPTGPPHSGKKPPVWVWIAAAAVLVLVIGIGVGFAVTSGGGDEPKTDPTPSEPADPSDPPTVETSVPTASDPTAPEPTAPETTEGPVTPDLSGARTNDIDGDGIGDLALLTPDGLRVYSSDGTSFADPVLRRNRAGFVGVAGDLDNDGRTDVVRVLGNPPRMSISSSVPGAPSSPLKTPDDPDLITGLDVPIALGDVDGDGNLDLVASSPLTETKVEIDVALGDGAGGFGATSPWYSGPLGEAEGSVLVADLDGDGAGDVVHVSTGRLTDANPQATFLRSDGGTLTVTGEVTEVDAAGFAVGVVTVGDPDGDGDNDIIGTTADDLKVNVWSWDGTALDQEPWYDDTANFETDNVTGGESTVSDVNGDGFDDLVVIGANSNTYESVVDQVFLSDGTTFSPDKSWRRSLDLEDSDLYRLLTQAGNNQR